MTIEIHPWPIAPRGGQHAGYVHSGVLAVDTETGIAVVVDEERSRIKNCALATARLEQLVVAKKTTRAAVAGVVEHDRAIDALGGEAEELQHLGEARRGLRRALQDAWQQLDAAHLAGARLVADRDAHAGRAVELAQRLTAMERERDRLYHAVEVANRAEVTARIDLESDEGTCPRCGSPKPHLHPASQHEGEVQVCGHVFHLKITPENTLERVQAAGLAPAEALDEPPATVDAKMKINRARLWATTGDGHGQHTEEP